MLNLGDHAANRRRVLQLGDTTDLAELDAERFERRAHRAAGDDAGTGGSGAQVDAAGAVAAGDVVMQRAAFAKCDARQVALRRLGRLADRLRNFARLAVAEPDPALLVAD